MKNIIVKLVIFLILFSKSYALEYEKTLLLYNNKHLNINNIDVGVLYAFNYPFDGTPSVMLKYKTEDNKERIVSYLAINPKTNNFVNRDISILSFYENESSFRFCDDKETYRLDNGKSESGVALAKVIVEEDENGLLHAVGLENDDIVKNFFKIKKYELEKRYKNLKNAKKTNKKTNIELLDKYSLVTAVCNSKLPLLLENENFSNEINNEESEEYDEE